MTARVGEAEHVRVVYQPLLNLHSGDIVAMEAFTQLATRAAEDLHRRARQAGHRLETSVVQAAAAIRAAHHEQLPLPVQVNLDASAVSGPPQLLDPLIEALQETARRPRDVVVEIGAPFAPHRDGLTRGVAALRHTGMRIAWDGLGAADLPLRLIATAGADALKLDAAVVAQLPDDPRCQAVLRALTHLADRLGAQLAATGVDTEEQLAALRRAGVNLAQGRLLAPPSRRPLAAVSLPPTAMQWVTPEGIAAPGNQTGPPVTEFVQPATILPEDATAHTAWTVLAERVTANSVVLADPGHRPRGFLDRTRFLLALSGPHGHALYTRRPAHRLADPPQAVGARTTALAVLHMLAGMERPRRHDDVVVIDDDQRVLGVVDVDDLVRSLVDRKVQDATARHPLTGLPGSEVIGGDIERRITAGEVFAVGWLDVDDFKTINDTHGPATGDDLIRTLGHTLHQAATAQGGVTVGHVGGDDFLLVTGLNALEPVASALLDRDLTAAGQPVALSLATLVCPSGSVFDYRDVSRRLAPIKRHAKTLHGASWVLGRPHNQRLDILRGSDTPAPGPTPPRHTKHPD